MSKFYTGAGDGGTSADFASPERKSKASQLFEALGTLDETVSILGLCRAKISHDTECRGGAKRREHTRCQCEILLTLQQNLFTIQAELAGSDKRLSDEKVRELEVQIAELGRSLPEIRTFLIPGETELGALFDLARTVARRAERELVRLRDEGKERVRPPILAYTNRLSSLLYVLARREAAQSGTKEQPPKYA